jgi:hypothetical protein
MLGLPESSTYIYTKIISCFGVVAYYNSIFQTLTTVNLPYQTQTVWYRDLLISSLIMFVSQKISKSGVPVVFLKFPSSTRDYQATHIAFYLAEIRTIACLRSYLWDWYCFLFYTLPRLFFY